MRECGQQSDWVTVTVEKGESLHDALRKRNIAPAFPCGGRGICGLCKVKVERFGFVKSCSFRLAGTYRVSVPQEDAFEVVQDAPGSETESPADDRAAEVVQVEGFEATRNELPEERDRTVRIAIDIGTTTVAFQLSYRGRACSGGFVNPQRQFGADVMTRIRAGADGKLPAMSQVIREALRYHIEPKLSGLLTAEGETEETADIAVAIAANTTMLHILNGWDTAGLGVAPFAPYSTALYQAAHANCRITELPGISAFVGADIVSGLYSAAIRRQKAPVFFLDLGTNGEMAVGNEARLLVASTAAGPAFEASEAALMLHASGLLAALKNMLLSGAMDENGTLSDVYFDAGYPVGDAVLSQDLIRDLQMAKAAIRAGIEILLASGGFGADEIAALYLAGGMGYFIDPEDAIAVGLIPEAFRGKIRAVGNTSLRGAIDFLKAPEAAAEELSQIAGMAEEIRLADHPDFEELYIGYMNFG